MSTSVTKTVSCPNCGVPHDMEIFTSINAADNPELKERILNEDLFDFRCERCGYTCQITYPLVYHDPTAGFMVIMYAQGQSGNHEEPPISLRNVVKRKVDSLAKLKEKILIFDAGFNDVAFGACEECTLGNHHKDISEHGCRLLFLKERGRRFARVCNFPCRQR